MQIAVDGYPRTYLIERPNTSRPSPTIIMLHGANGTAGAIAQLTNLARLGPQDGFVTVFPQSRASVWNRFQPGRESPQAIELFRKFGGPPNDIGFLKMLVADLVRAASPTPPACIRWSVERRLHDAQRVLLRASPDCGYRADRLVDA
jgi:poly(3-hydroxybutyrate) depolymerase